MDIEVPSSEIIEVDFRPRDADLDDVGLRVKARHPVSCWHNHTTVDETLRIVTCRDCDAKLDPVEVLLKWAKDWERYADSVKGLRDEQQRRRNEIDDLKRQRKNLKSQIRRAEKRAGLGDREAAIRHAFVGAVEYVARAPEKSRETLVAGVADRFAKASIALFMREEPEGPHG